MTEPMPEPTDQQAADPWPEPASMPLVFREGRLTPDGPYPLQINGVEVPRSLLDAVRKFTRSSAAEIDKLRAKLAGPCGSCHPCLNWVGEEWRRLDRKPPYPDQWDQGQADRRHLRALLREALDGWEGNPPVSANARARHAAAIARLREAGGLT